MCRIALGVKCVILPPKVHLMVNWLSYQVLMRYKTILWIIFPANLTLSIQDIYWMVVTGQVRHPQLTPWHPHKYPFQFQFHNSLSLFIPNHFIVILRFPSDYSVNCIHFCAVKQTYQDSVSARRPGHVAWCFVFSRHKYFLCTSVR